MQHVGTYEVELASWQQELDAHMLYEEQQLGSRCLLSPLTTDANSVQGRAMPAEGFLSFCRTPAMSIVHPGVVPALVVAFEGVALKWASATASSGSDAGYVHDFRHLFAQANQVTGLVLVLLLGGLWAAGARSGVGLRRAPALVLIGIGTLALTAPVFQAAIIAYHEPAHILAGPLLIVALAFLSLVLAVRSMHARRRLSPADSGLPAAAVDMVGRAHRR